MTADVQTFGFPAGYFVILSLATQRLWDVEADEVEDGTDIALWPEKEKSLVEGKDIFNGCSDFKGAHNTIKVFECRRLITRYVSLDSS